jgi:hypothetical protein
MIPEEIKQKIAVKYPLAKDNGSINIYIRFNREAAQYGYSLAQEEMVKMNEKIMLLSEEIDINNDTHTALLSELQLKDREVQTLKSWKAEALSVMPDYQAIGKALNIKLGESIHDKILSEIQRLKELIQDAHDHAYGIAASNLDWSIDKSWKEFKKQYNLI